MHSQFIKFHKELFQVIIDDAVSSRNLGGLFSFV